MNRSSSSDFPVELSQSQDDLSEDTSNDTIRNSFTDKNICGEGASCIVYRTRWKGLRVAIKRLKTECRTVPTYVASYRKEFQLGQQLKHDALPIYREMQETSNEVYIVMDYVDGVSLSDFLTTDTGRQYFSRKANVKRFLSQLLGVITYLHHSGVIHCDIKPANIMLRHSDRGVMLLDLDKAYCDSLDRTHGGTVAMSDPMSNGETPTVTKDFIAIGNLIGYISEEASAFPKRRFSKLQRECRNPNANDESIVKALESKSHIGELIICSVAISLLATGGYYYGSQNTSSEESGTEKVTPTVVSDTVRIIEERQSQTNDTPVTTPVKQKAIAVDFDKRMAVFIDEANSALALLQNGELSDKEIRNRISDLLETYTSTYQSILNDYKTENPDMSGIDVEMAVARLSERSKATALLQQFTQAAADTLTSRNPQMGKAVSRLMR